MSINYKQIKYCIYKLSDDQRIIEIDEEFTKLTGYTMEDIKQLDLRQKDLIPEESVDGYLELVATLLQESGEAYIEHAIVKKDGSEVIVFCLGTTNSDGTFTIRVLDLNKSLTMLSKSKSIEKKYNKKLQKLVEEATTDNLTGLLRRETFQFKVENYIKNQMPSSYVMMDIDNFKGINDTYGHECGDRILKEVSKIFEEVVGNNGITCRFGGDEFAMFLLNIETVKDIEEYLNKLNKEMKKVTIRENKDYKVTLSIGATFINNFDKELLFDDLYKKTDKLLYTSKKNGKNQYTIK